MIKKSVMKKSAPKKQQPKKSEAKKTALADASIKILETAKCKTVSEKSDLTYNIALNEKGQAMIRIASNTGGGFWSKEHVYIGAIVDCIQSVPEDQSITSIHLFKLFVGKSQNTPGFLLAVLLKEGLLEPLGKKRQYKVSAQGVDKFLEKVNKLKSAKQNS